MGRACWGRPTGGAGGQKRLTGTPWGLTPPGGWRRAGSWTTERLGRMRCGELHSFSALSCDKMFSFLASDLQPETLLFNEASTSPSGQPCCRSHNTAAAGFMVPPPRSNSSRNFSMTGYVFSSRSFPRPPAPPPRAAFPSWRCPPSS